MDRFNIPGTARASFAVYNTLEEVDRFADALRDIVAKASASGRDRYSYQASGGPTFSGAAEYELAYPQAVASSPTAAAEEMADVFEFLDDWADRYEYLMDLGKDLPQMPEYLKTDENRVQGCQSVVFFAMGLKPGTAEVFEFLGTSDAQVVRGLIALLERIYSGQRAADVVAFDAGKFFARLGLENLSTQRRIGLDSMVQRIRRFAAILAGQPDAARA
jgi:cysteine desulfurase/selenocysteine lyase